MRLTEGVEWGLHCGVVLAVLPSGAALSTARLAGSSAGPEASLARHLQAMSGAGILEAGTGGGGGYRLARPPADVSVLDVVEAVDGGDPAFRCLEIRRRGPAALPAREYRTMCGIHRVMVEADEAWRAQLARTSIADPAAAGAPGPGPE